MSSKPNNNAHRSKGASAKTDPIPRSFGSVRILVADDEHLPATGLANSAADLGHTIVGIAPDGERAVAIAREHRPDLALLDIRMPVMSGIDAATVLFSELRIPSIIVSAYSDEEHVRKIHAHGESAGVFGYLLKPVSREQLAVAIGIALQRAAVDGQHAARVQQLETNLQQRRTVEQAKWVLVEKHKMTEAQAHEALQKLARNQRRQLADVAQIVVTTGDLPA